MWIDSESQEFQSFYCDWTTPYWILYLTSDRIDRSIILYIIITCAWYQASVDVFTVSVFDFILWFPTATRLGKANKRAIQGYTDTFFRWFYEFLQYWDGKTCFWEIQKNVFDGKKCKKKKKKLCKIPQSCILPIPIITLLAHGTRLQLMSSPFQTLNVILNKICVKMTSEPVDNFITYHNFCIKALSWSLHTNQIHRPVLNTVPKALLYPSWKRDIFWVSVFWQKLSLRVP